MPNNPTKILLSMTLIGGILISISSNSWLGAWMGLEINLMSFIPLMSSQENIFTTEASLKYFVIQALASSVLLFLVAMKTLINQGFMVEGSLHEYVIMTPLLLKMGAAPLHWWFPSVMEGLSWENCLLMMTVQKAAPMMLTSYLMKINPLILTIVIMSVMVGSIGGMNQTSLRKILTYSSINHTGWMLMALMDGKNLWMMYFMVYSLLTLTMATIMKMHNISFINQMLSTNGKTTIKFMLFMTLLSLGGLPPFIGFLPKWTVIQTMIMNDLSVVMTVMVIMSLMTLYYYLRVCYSSFIILHNEMKWGPQMFKVSEMIMYGVILSSTSMMGLVVCTMITNIN
uniref:NADH-ubiquinone oxidoreductase chain 2 n=1 Tax=Procryptotermes speiseri TaxID=2942699 RepID=A0A8X8M3X0_9NEOP|nr:NADH dehydrogenase subunit 2 [Procryptotermes speiseri]